METRRRFADGWLLLIPLVALRCGPTGDGTETPHHHGDETEHEGTHPEGTEHEGTHPEGTEHEGTHPEGTEHEGTHPEGTEHEGTHPEGTEHEGTHPEGTEHEGTGTPHSHEDTGTPSAEDTSTPHAHHTDTPGSTTPELPTVTPEPTVSPTPSATSDLDGDGSLHADDCNDRDASAYPGAQETCDHLDDDCDKKIDEDPNVFWWPDGDADLYRSDTGGVENCHPPNNSYLSTKTAIDCDDANKDVHPGATELCDDIDHDCDGALTPCVSP